MKPFLWALSIIVVITQSLLGQNLKQEIQEEETNARMWYGYLGSIPETPYGLAIGTTNINVIGFYIAAKSNFQNQTKDFYEDVSENKARNIFMDRETESKKGSSVIELGITARISKIVYIYGGLGYATTKTYLQFHDKFEILGSNGNYWIQKEETNGVNLNGGLLLFPEGKFYFQLGYDTKPAGINIGIGLTTNSFLNY